MNKMLIDPLVLFEINDLLSHHDIPEMSPCGLVVAVRLVGAKEMLDALIELDENPEGCRAYLCAVIGLAEIIATDGSWCRSDK